MLFYKPPYHHQFHILMVLAQIKCYNIPVKSTSGCTGSATVDAATIVLALARQFSSEFSISPKRESGCT